MSDAESSTQTATCPLLKLPPEIRNRIWTLILTVGIVYIKGDCPKQSDEHLCPTTMAVAHTCRQIYREVTPIYYSKNLFYFHLYSPIDSPQRFAAAIGPANAESIAAVEFPYTFQAMFFLRGLMEMRSPFPNLKALWASHTNYFEQDYHKLVTQLIQRRINLLETQTGRQIKESHDQSHVVEANPEH